MAIKVDRDTNSSMLARLRLLEGDECKWYLSPKGPTAYFGGRYGLSGGLYDRHIVRGVSGLAGDYGHMIVDPGGDQCWCGRTGCLETKIGLASLHKRKFKKEIPLEILATDGPRLIQELQEARDAGDPEVLESLEFAGHWVALSVNAIAAIANPYRIVIDGYLGQLGDPVLTVIKERLNEIRELPQIHRLVVEGTNGDPSLVLQGTLVAALYTVVNQPLISAHPRLSEPGFTNTSPE